MFFGKPNYHAIRRRSYCLTVAIPTLVTSTDVGRVKPHERAGRRNLEPLRDHMRQDALALAGLLDVVAERGELGWQRRSRQRLEPASERGGSGALLFGRTMP
jgi:hypothetical protein